MPDADEWFDCHVHLGPSDSGELYYGRLEGAEYLRLMEVAGIRRALAFPPLRYGGYREANAALAEWCEGPGAGRIRPLARVGGRLPPVEAPYLWIARRWLRGFLLGRAPDFPENVALERFAGIKLLPLLDGLPSRAFFERVNEAGLPFLTHGGFLTSPRWIARAILPRVRTKLVIAHLGAFPAQERLLHDAIELARREPKVYLDTSGIWPVAYLRQALAAVPEKLLFGSDCPLTTPLAARRQLEAATDDAGLRRRVACEAAVEVFGSF